MTTQQRITQAEEDGVISKSEGTTLASIAYHGGRREREIVAQYINMAEMLHAFAD
jgi:hypothetical protein